MTFSTFVPRKQTASLKGNTEGIIRSHFLGEEWCVYTQMLNITQFISTLL